MAIDYNDPIVQLEAINLMQPVKTYLYDTFVDDRGAVDADEALWDVKRGNLPMAPFVHDTIGGVVVERGGFYTDKIVFPTLAPERVVKGIDLKKRSFNEAVYGGMTPEERAQKMIADDLLDLLAMIAKRQEWMVAQLLVSGKIDILKYTDSGQVSVAEKVVDFGFENEYIATNKWNTAGSDIVGDMERCVDMVREGQGNCDIIVMSANAKNALINNEKYAKLLDNRRMNFGGIDPAIMQQYQGLTYLGQAASGQDMFVYSGTYIDENKTVQKYIPDGKVIFASKKMFKGYFGPITQVTEDGINGKFETYISKYVPLRYASQKDNNVRQRVTSRPMFAPYNVDGWAVATVL